jgi:hypothetical protein
MDTHLAMEGGRKIVPIPSDDDDDDRMLGETGIFVLLMISFWLMVLGVTLIVFWVLGLG